MQQPYYDDVLGYVRRFTRENSQPFVETKVVSEQFPEVSKRTVFNRLDELADRDELNKRQVGANSTVWWPADQESA